MRAANLLSVASTCKCGAKSKDGKKSLSRRYRERPSSATLPFASPLPFQLNPHNAGLSESGVSSLLKSEWVDIIRMRRYCGIVNMPIKCIESQAAVKKAEPQINVAKAQREASAVEKMVSRGTETLRHILRGAGSERLGTLQVAINEFQYFVKLAEIVLESGKFLTDPAEKKLNEARLRGVNRVAQLRKAAEPLLETGQVCDLLGVSRETVRKKVDGRKLLALPKGADRVFPAFQFKEGAVLPGFAEALSALDTESPFTALSFFLSKNSDFDGTSAIELLEAGEMEPVLAEARSLLKHGV
jgi:hypothetical protein